MQSKRPCDVYCVMDDQLLMMFRKMTREADQWLNAVTMVTTTSPSAFVLTAVSVSEDRKQEAAGWTLVMSQSPGA